MLQKKYLLPLYELSDPRQQLVAEKLTERPKEIRISSVCPRSLDSFHLENYYHLFKLLYKMGQDFFYI